MLLYVAKDEISLWDMSFFICLRIANLLQHMLIYAVLIKTKNIQQCALSDLISCCELTIVNRNSTESQMQFLYCSVKIAASYQEWAYTDLEIFYVYSVRQKKYEKLKRILTGTYMGNLKLKFNKAS